MSSKIHSKCAGYNIFLTLTSKPYSVISSLKFKITKNAKKKLGMMPKKRLIRESSVLPTVNKSQPGFLLWNYDIILLWYLWDSMWNSTDKQMHEEPFREQQSHSPETFRSNKSCLGILLKYLNKFMKQLSVSLECGSQWCLAWLCVLTKEH